MEILPSQRHNQYNTSSNMCRYIQYMHVECWHPAGAAFVSQPCEQRCGLFLSLDHHSRSNWHPYRTRYGQDVTHIYLDSHCQVCDMRRGRRPEPNSSRHRVMYREHEQLVQQAEWHVPSTTMIDAPFRDIQWHRSPQISSTSSPVSASDQDSVSMDLSFGESPTEEYTSATNVNVNSPVDADPTTHLPHIGRLKSVDAPSRLVPAPLRIRVFRPALTVQTNFDNSIPTPVSYVRQLFYDEAALDLNPQRLILADTPVGESDEDMETASESSSFGYPFTVDHDPASSPDGSDVSWITAPQRQQSRPPTPSYARTQGLFPPRSRGLLPPVQSPTPQSFPPLDLDEH